MFFEFLILCVFWYAMLRGVCYLLDSYRIIPGMMALFDTPLFPEKEKDPS